MTATRKTPAKKTTAKKPTVRRTTARRPPPRRRTTRRPRPALSTTIGSAIGALIVTTLLDLSWPVRIALIVAVLVIGLGYVVWKNRTAIASAAAADRPEGPDQPDDTAGPPPEGPASVSP